MACYVDEEEVWKCPKHPSKRRRSGVCPTCLRDRLTTLCPECASTRPCSCNPVPIDSTSTSSSSSSYSSSFSIFQFSRGGSLRDGFLSGEVGRVSNLIDSEPAFRKSRSLAIPFLRSRSKNGVSDREFSRSKSNFWSVFKVSKTKTKTKTTTGKCDSHDDESCKSEYSGSTDDYPKMMRSRSVAVTGITGGRFSPATIKRRRWYFPSPLKAFRQSKTSKLQLHELSPMHRG